MHLTDGHRQECLCHKLRKFLMGWAAQPFLVVILAAAGPLWGAVPTPKGHFGHEIGADRTVLDWDRVVSYFRALEQASPRIKVQEIGQTAEGRPMIAAFVSAPDTIRNLSRYIEIQKKLA